MGLAVNVASEARLTEIRAWGKDFRYCRRRRTTWSTGSAAALPALITSTAIQQ